jgi:hypothetical protein
MEKPISWPQQTNRKTWVGLTWRLAPHKEQGRLQIHKPISRGKLSLFERSYLLSLFGRRNPRSALQYSYAFFITTSLYFGSLLGY